MRNNGELSNVVLGNIKTVKGFYVDSMACLRGGMDLSYWFSVSVGLRQAVM